MGVKSKRRERNDFQVAQEIEQIAGLRPVSSVRVRWVRSGALLFSSHAHQIE